MTVSEALEEADYVEIDKTRLSERTPDALLVLAAEVRRLRKETFELVKDLLAGTPEGIPRD